MEEFKIPTKLMNMCKTCVQNTRSAVRIEGTLSYLFENKTGLKESDTSSTILFNSALPKVTECIKMVSSGKKIGKEQFNISTYAGEIA
jgi:hypothetical protein